jgi:UMF1 family MFS transporter
MAADFGLKLGFSSNALIQALLLVQFVSFPCALLFGRLGDRIGTKRAIYLGLAVFLALTCYAYVMQTERSSTSSPRSSARCRAACRRCRVRILRA